MPHRFTQAIIKELLQKFPFVVPNPAMPGDGVWTYAIMQALAVVGGPHGFGYTPKCRRKHGGTGEYLLDHTWLKYSALGDVIEVPFSCESELDFSAQGVVRRRKDFNKLLLSRSPYRMFICQESAMNGAHTAVLDTLQSWLVQFQHTQLEDHFLLLVLDYRSQSIRTLTIRELEYRSARWTPAPDMQYLF